MYTLTEHYLTSKKSTDPTAHEHWGDVTAEPGGVDYLEVDAGGVPAMWAIPHGAPADSGLLCFHGGGFVSGSRYTHRKLFGHLAKAAGARALIPDYRRTPEFRHPAQLDDASTTYQWLLDQGINNVAFAGDSAGGLLTVTTTLRARERGLPAPAALLPFSPWFDLEFSGESLVTNLATDILFGGDSPMDLSTLVDMFLGPDGDRTDPLANPINADLTGLPPVYLQVSGSEMLLDDSVTFERRAREAGVEVRLDIFPGQQHTWHFSAGRTPGGRRRDPAHGRMGPAQARVVLTHLNLADIRPTSSCSQVNPHRRHGSVM